MSADGQGDTENLKKGEETPAATVPEGIPSTSTIDESGSRHTLVDQNTPLTLGIKADNCNDDNLEESLDEIENIIEKKLPKDKEKALDEDSELDFELKWDDDTDLNDDQANDIGDIDLDSVEREDSTLKSAEKHLEKDLDKETDSILTCIENDLVKGLDNVDEEADSVLTSMEKDLEKDLDSTDKEIQSELTSIDEGLDTLGKDTEDTAPSIEEVLDNADKEVERTLTSVDEGLNSVGKEIDISNIEKNLDNADKEMQSPEKDLDNMEQKKETTTLNNLEFRADDNMDINTNILDIDSAEEAKSKPEDNVLDLEVDESGIEVQAFNVDTTKIDLESKTPSTESETNSLDEQLVYSDAEAPDIDDKELLDEIDAQITEAEKNINELGIADSAKASILLEPSTSQKSNDDKKSQKDTSEMDVDVDLIDVNPVKEPDPNDTCSSVPDTDTSSYDINNEHRLDKPDVMIEIPTQELIESFDDSEETSDADKSDNNPNKPDLIINTISEHNENLTEPQESGDKNDIAKPISDKDDAKNVFDKLLTDEDTAINKNKLVSDVPIEIMEVDSNASEEINLVQKIPENNSNEEVIKPDQENVDSALEEKVTHADIILEANSESEVVSAANTASEGNVDSALEEKVTHADIILEANSESEVVSAANTASEGNVDSALEEKVTHADIKLEANSEPEVVSAANTTSDLDVKLEENKNDEEVKSSEVKNIEDVTKATTDVDEVQPSTSKTKYHQESSDEDQEVTDSLGLLAESSRVMEDDDEQEPDDDDDDDDFDQDDESNQMTAEHSEDSNAQHSETDVPKETMDVDESNYVPEPLIDDVAETHEIEETGDESHEAFENEAPVDESSGDKDDFQIQIGTVVGGNTEVEIQDSNEATDATEDSLEVQKAVDTILEDKMTEESSDVPTASIEETVKLSDSDSDGATKGESSKLRNLLLKDSDSSNGTPAEKKSPSKTKKLEISKPKNEINIVELEESSSEDDIQVVNKQAPVTPSSPKDVTSADIPTEVGVTGDTVTPPGEGGDLPTTAATEPASLNTEEVATKAASAAESPAISETTAPKTPEAKTPVDLGSEIFSLDSDDEETTAKSKRKKRLTAVEIDKTRETNKCINTQCTSDPSVPLVPASVAAVVYYAASQQRGGLCVNCAQRMAERSEKLIEGVKDLTPYMNMDMCMIREEFVEISDSDSDEEPDLVQRDDEIIGEEGAKFLEEHLADMFNDTWKKFDMEARLLTAQAEISVEVGQMEEECKKIDAMLHECQMETDKLRNDLYDTFADERRELPGITIYDTPVSQWSGLEEVPPTPIEKIEPRQPKRRLPPPPEPPAKRAPIPLGYTPLDSDSNKQPETKAAPAPLPDVIAQPEDDNADISVVKLCVESAPAGLPGPGVATRPPLRPNMSVYAMRNAFGAWHRVRIVEVQPKVPGQFTMCRVRFEHPKNTSKLLPARCLAYEHAPDVRLTIGTRVVALFKDHRMSLDKKEEHIEKKEAYYSGIVAEIPNPVNNYRYLIFFDDGYAQYVQHAVTRLVCECAPRVWDEVHPFSRQFVRDYLRAYPERPMVRLHAGQSIKTEWNGKWWPSKVIQVDASLVHVLFEGKKEAGVEKTEWIYRGSTRLAPLYLELQAAERQRSRPLPRAQAGRRFNMPYVEYTRSDEPAAAAPAQPPPMTPAQSQAQIEQEIRRQRAVAKKSTALPAPQAARENVTSRVVFYTPKNAIRPLKMTPHTCGPQCKRTDVLALKDLRTYNPLAKPLLTGWERHQVRFRSSLKAIMYRAPCGRRIRDYRELHYYLQAINSDMGVDLFDFNPATHCLSEFLLNKCLVSKKDLSHGKENVPVPCVNYYDDSLPEFCSYNTERTPTAGVPLNLDPEFLCGCDCTDDCADKSKCACWKMTLEGARTIGLDTDEVGYVYKRLPEPLPSGIYECNSRCKCKQTCLNRVAQHPLQLKLQVFKTANRGWGIRALNDVPKGAFLCVYAGNLLTDATANLDGLNEGDEYLAELDYIEVVEQMKEGFEEDIPEDAKKLDQESSSPSSLSSSDSEPAQEADDDFRPAVADTPYTRSEYSKRLRKREKSKKAKEKEEKEKKEKDGNTDDCITISDDEELREPARFAARAGMGGKEFISKYKSVRAHFGKDEACYIMDAKVQGNIGRYLNHSCTPNVFVQNVFVDTHDPRFPWVAFFALSQITAGTELTWNYNYDVGSVPGKVLYCYCNAHNCRGRLL